MHRTGVRVNAKVSIEPGLMVIHGNQPDVLRNLLASWMRRYPLSPLEAETVLVQSNGIAQWLKLALARDVADGGLGVAASLDLALPSQFLWRAYRSVLGADQVPELSVLDKSPLAWRLMRLLPSLLEQAVFSPLQGFLHDDGGLRRRHQLSERLADLFDQYQVYRSDWLDDWALGRDQLRQARGHIVELPPAQRWQAQLWRELLADAGPQQLQASRVGVHRRFVEQLSTAEPGTIRGLPRRVTVFGISSMPAQNFEALHAMARHCQVLLCVHNPSRHHWADIVADKDLLRHEFKRHARRPALAGRPAAADEDSHQNAQPLLAAWGKQGRDYIHMLDQFDDPASYRHQVEPLTGGRIDLFDEPDTQTLLGQLQADILDLRPLAETREQWPPVDVREDVSIRFHVAHSAQREVEILHDQLLARLQADPALAPREIIVMVPDIDAYAPHIEAVFGQLTRDDPRFIPYTVADRARRGREPMLVALEYLLQLPDNRVAASEVLDLLDVAAVRKKLGIADVDLPLLRRWIEGAGVRWGLDGAHRERLDLPAAREANSWRFGLRRMLLGFAVGQGESFQGIEPYDEIGGLDAATLGPLAQLLDDLDRTLLELAEPAVPQQWAVRLRELLDRFFEASNESESLARLQMLGLIDPWLKHCELAGFDQPLPLTVVRESWLAGIDEGGLNQRFMSGAVSFCTLLPMRAIPFKVVCLLGMNDGDYPRRQPHMDFDLMQGDYRPGDRSRREDDRYLMLEALLSAGEQLYVSWVGRSIRDNGERAPSVLVGQLRDHLAGGWRSAHGNLLQAMTLEHPLQPFSSRYFSPAIHDADPENAGLQQTLQGHAVDGLYTYAHEWRPSGGPPRGAAGAEQEGTESPAVEVLSAMAVDAPLSLRMLSDFLVQPVQAFFRQRLQVAFLQEQEVDIDDESFGLDGLQSWQVNDDLCERLRGWIERTVDDPARDCRTAAAGLDGDGIAARVGIEMERLQREGRLPLAAFGELAAKETATVMSELLLRYAGHLQQLRHLGHTGVESLDVRHVQVAPGSSGQPPLMLEDTLTGVRTTSEGRVNLQLVSGRLHEGSTYKWSSLVRHWLHHLALQLTGAPVRTVLVSASGDVIFEALAESQARALLDDLMSAWQDGMRMPLPVACRTALAWLAQVTPVVPTDAGDDGHASRAAADGVRKARRAAQAVYDGGFNMEGERDRHAGLARAYPDFDRLSASGDFVAWAERLYRPLLTHLRPSVPASSPAPTYIDAAEDRSGADA